MPGPYRVVVANPPWPWRDRLPGPRGAHRHYYPRPITEIMRYPLPWMTPDSVLFLWRVSSMVEEAYQVARVWGFTPKTELVWQKTTRFGRPWFGMGHALRNSHETCIVAVRGDWKPKIRSVRTTFTAPVGDHSHKPDMFYELVQSLAEGPYCEMFGRQERKGWCVYGDDIPNGVIDLSAPPEPAPAQLTLIPGGLAEGA